ncbi:unnamed protein product [Prorocentrum cordatum]|uniref:Uncharacterized protein n=1 Tax=Prorocentrum cordatum TaxID=2364126 RepID=A0ABN9PFU8_9DINO|nr:unnamed protein product [Polarella glacialis]
MRPPAPSAAPGRMGWGRARGGYGRGAGKGGWPRRVGRGKAGGRGSLAAGAGRRAAAAQAAASSPLKRVIKGYLKRQARDDERRQADRLGLREGPAASRGGGQGGVLVRQARAALNYPLRGVDQAWFELAAGQGRSAQGRREGRARQGRRPQQGRQGRREGQTAGLRRSRPRGRPAGAAGQARLRGVRARTERVLQERWRVGLRGPAGEALRDGRRRLQVLPHVWPGRALSRHGRRGVHVRGGRAVRLREPPRLEGRRPMRAGRGLHALGVPMTRGGGAASRRPGAASATAMPPRGRIPIPIPSPTTPQACGSSSRLSLPRPSASPRLLVRPPARPPPCSDAWEGDRG